MAEEYAGQSGRCHRCGGTVTIPKDLEPVVSRAGPSGTALGVALVLGLCALLSCAGVLMAIWLPAFQSARQAAQRTQCANNLRQIMTALRSYQAQYGTFPPAWLPDATGKPAHSWRVLILPQLGQQVVYQQYNFNEPWNGPNNILLAAQMPQVFACPAHQPTPGSMTSYVAITGPGTATDPVKPAGPANFSDGANLTLLVGEIASSPVPWMSPTDVDISLPGLGVDTGSPGNELSSNHFSGVHVVTADGIVRLLPAGTPAAQLQAMGTVAGGEATPMLTPVP